METDRAEKSKEKKGKRRKKRWGRRRQTERRPRRADAAPEITGVGDFCRRNHLKSVSLLSLMGF